MRQKPRWGWRGLLFALTTAVSGYAYARQATRTQIAVEQVTIPVAGLPPALRGLTIVHMSDFHFSSATPPRFVRHAVALANSVRPDVVALTGDFGMRSPLLAHELAQMLQALRPRLATFAVRGNHDFVRRGVAAPIEQRLAEVGIRTLVNEGVTLIHKGARLYVAGLDDLSWGKPDLRQALAGVEPAVPVILLAHAPDVAAWTAFDERVLLQLSGHSHGGQICLPGGKPLILPENGRIYPRGLYRVRQTWVYTTRGIGVTRIPLRLNCPPEITRLTLVPAATAFAV